MFMGNALYKSIAPISGPDMDWIDLHEIADKHIGCTERTGGFTVPL